MNANDPPSQKRVPYWELDIAAKWVFVAISINAMLFTWLYIAGTFHESGIASLVFVSKFFLHSNLTPMVMIVCTAVFHALMNLAWRKFRKQHFDKRVAMNYVKTTGVLLVLYLLAFFQDIMFTIGIFT